MKRRSAFLDSQRVIGGGFTAHERELRRNLAKLIGASYMVLSDLSVGYLPDAKTLSHLENMAKEAERILEPKRK